MKSGLPASSAPETMAASLLFLLVFCISLETVTRVRVADGKNSVWQAESDLQECIRRFAAEPCDAGEYRRTYKWGEIAVRAAPYPDVPEVMALEFRTVPKNGGRETVYRMLVAYGN